jgi:signal transduction histidine kinase
MTSGPQDPRWPKLLSLSVHELRTPMTVVAGYIRMLLKDRAGPVTDQQRRLLEEAEKSCGRLSALLAEMSELSNLEGGTAPFNRSSVDLHTVLTDTIATLPEVPDREIEVVLSAPDGPVTVEGDPVRLKTAFTAVLNALRRELVTSTQLFVRERAHTNGAAQAWVAIADADHIDALSVPQPPSLMVFDEWRGGCGLSLAIARRVINAHGGAIWSPEGVKAGAVIMLPMG